MEAKIRNRLTMLNATVLHFDESPDHWSGHEPIVLHLGTIRDGRDTIQAAADAQARHDPRGLTTDKEAALHHAAKLLAGLGGPATTYAIDTRNDDLRRAVDRSLTDWTRLPEATFFAEATRALDRMEQALDPLGPYGITRNDVTEARAAVTAARPLTAARDDVAAHRTVATDILRDTYSTLVPSLDALDNLVPRLITDPDFVATYFKVRKIPGE